MQKTKLAASARAFLNCPFDLLVDMLSLEPKEDWHLWLDPEGNRLRISKNRAVQVYPTTAQAQKTKDVFRKAPPQLIEHHSYWGALIAGNTQNILILLGNDGKLRSCHFKDNIWVENTCPLLLGFGILRYIISGYLEPGVRVIKSLNISYPNEFGIENAWAFGLPIEDNNIKERVRCLLKIQDSTE